MNDIKISSKNAHVGAYIKKSSQIQLDEILEKKGLRVDGEEIISILEEHLLDNDSINQLLYEKA